MSGIATSSRILEQEPCAEFQLNGYVSEICWTPDGSRVAVASLEGEAAVFDVAAGRRAWSRPELLFGISSAAICTEAGLLGCCGDEKKLSLLSLESGETLQELALPAWAERLRFSDDGALMAVAAGREVLVYQREGSVFNPYLTYTEHDSTVSDIAWQPGGDILAACAYGALSLWTGNDAKDHRRFRWKGSSLRVAWSPDSRYLATGDQDATVHIWFVDSGKDLQMRGFETKVLELSWDHSGRYLATGGGVVPTVWDCSGKTGPENRPPVELFGHKAQVKTLSFARQHSLLVAGDEIGDLCAWNPTADEAPGEPLERRTLSSALVYSAFSPDDSHLAIGGADGVVSIFRTRWNERA